MYSQSGSIPSGGLGLSRLWGCAVPGANCSLVWTLFSGVASAAVESVLFLRCFRTLVSVTMLSSVHWVLLLLGRAFVLDFLDPALKLPFFSLIVTSKCVVMVD